MAAFLFFFFLFPLSSFYNFAQVQAQARAPHGLNFENPIALSPSAFDFFHPESPSPKAGDPCDESKCAPMTQSTYSMASSAVVRATPGHESRVSTDESSRMSKIRAGGIAGIVFGFVFAVLLAIGVYYVMVTRRTNINRSNSVQPDV